MAVKVGVFDSGIGGLSVVQAIEKALPEVTVVFKNDAQHVPYGTRQPTEILKFITPIFQQFIDEGCSVIVIACNTISTTLATELGERFDIPFITVEPLVNQAVSLTKSKVIAVCATPTTLASKHYKRLRSLYAKDVTVLEPDCSNWALMIENNEVDEWQIVQTIRGLLLARADVIVLGCTHYHWIESEIKALVGKDALVIQPEAQVVAELNEVLAQLA